MAVMVVFIIPPYSQSHSRPGGLESSVLAYLFYWLARSYRPKSELENRRHIGYNRSLP